METVLSIHDHLINASGYQQVTCVCLLNLSNIFDTTDHTILFKNLPL